MAMPALSTDRIWTTEMLAALPEDGQRYEIVDGELLVSPAPTLRHQRAAAYLGDVLRAYARTVAGIEAFGLPIGVRFSQTTEVQPDVCVLPLVDGKPADSFEAAGRLLLAIEIVSPSTARHDRFTKRRKYLDQGVPEYWIVDLDQRTVERWHPGEECPVIVRDAIEWRAPGAATSCHIALQSFFAEVCGDTGVGDASPRAASF